MDVLLAESKKKMKKSGTKRYESSLPEVYQIKKPVTQQKTDPFEDIEEYQSMLCKGDNDIFKIINP